ncbi:MAG: peptidase [Armatimonadetes bacterium 55-13]|nr:MAG: peptidase [Armatimonadetes bacterium 55-13]
MSSESASKARQRPFRLKVHSWLRWLHIYTSMLSLLVVLFFAITGITLNHPDWVIGNVEAKAEVKGQLNKEWISGKEVNWLQVVEYLRKTHNVRGSAEDMRAEETEGSLSFRSPGYAADCFFDRDSGKYEMSIDSMGMMAVMNDLHRGKDSSKAWAWLIDLSGIFLALLSLTGLGILFYLKKLRRSALITAAVGIVLFLILMRLTT